MVTEPSISDEDSTTSFETFFRENYSSLWRYVARRVPASSVDDIVSTSFVVAWKKFSSIEAPSLPWLIRIASFEVSNDRRKLRREGLRIVSGAIEEIAGPRDDAFDGSLVRAALTGLSVSDQEVLRLVLWDELSRADIAQILGISTNAVNVRFHRALKNFERSSVVPHHVYPTKESPHGY